jgi:gamma-glutamyltranspeptidase/glutathione hydrolase
MPLARLAGKPYAAQRAAGIDPEWATPSGQLPESREGGNTTHFSIVDREGNRVAATLSINTFFGSGFVAGKTGVLLNNEMDDFAAVPGQPNVYGLIQGEANAIAPGKRPLSSMSPTFVEDKRGVLVLGTPGGSRIISMVLLGILGYVQEPVPDVARIVSLPRFHHQFQPDRVEVEQGAFSAALIQELELKGHVVETAGRAWGNMQAVFVDKRTGRAKAASDPRAGPGRPGS